MILTLERKQMFKSIKMKFLLVLFAISVMGIVLFYPKDEPIKDIPTECFDIHDDGSVEKIPCGKNF
jgi:zona occludens toxin (predicted ATPase)